MQHEREKMHTIENTTYCDTVGGVCVWGGNGVIGKKEPNGQKFKKGGDNLVFVSLHYTVLYISNIT